MNTNQETPRENKTEYSVRFISRDPMTKSGFEMWGHLMRRHISKYRYTFGQNMLCIPNLHYTTLQTDQALGEFCCQYFGENQVYVYMYSHAKTRTHVALKCVAIVDIKDSDNRKFTVRTVIKSRRSKRPLNRLSRFWFRKGNKDQGRTQ